MQHFKITVSGRVQGVYFRASTKAVADKLNISGFVRNQNNGDVYLEAEGEEQDIKQLLEWLEAGPPSAKVASLDIDEGKPKNIEGFEIRT